MSVFTRIVRTAFVVIGFSVATVVYGQEGTTYTTVAQFNEATNFRHNTEGVTDPTDGSLVITNQVHILPYLWVACSTRGTVVRIATCTVDPITGRTGVQPGQVLGEYRVAPDGCARNPSRTAVDFDGSVWVGNRQNVGWNALGQVVKIGSGLVSHEWKDRDLPGNVLGQLDTSTGLGDIRAWPNGPPTQTCDGRSIDWSFVDEGDVTEARDELILLYQPVEPTDVRQVSVTRQNDVWVAGTGNHELRLLDGRTGDVIFEYEGELACPGNPPAPSGAYGGFVDRCGGLWSASGGFGEDLVRVVGQSITCLENHPWSYGLGVDTGGYAWTTLHALNKTHRLNPVNHSYLEYGIGLNQSEPKGLAVSPFNNDVWIANSRSDAVTRLPNDGVNQPQVVDLEYGEYDGVHPTGVAVDQGGFVWVTNRNSHDVMRINPATNAVDLRVPLGDGCGPYNYSDMTALNLMSTVAPAGVWSAVHDSGVEDTVWGTVTWNAAGAAPRTSLMVQVRAANVETDLGKARYMTVLNGVPFECAECDDPMSPCYAVVGRYVQVRVQLNGFCYGETGNGCYGEDPVACGPWPTLQDITITPSATVENCNGNGIPDDCPSEQLTMTDCNDNDIPDECEVPPICPECLDCNENGVPDECEEDCNINDIPDECDIDEGESCDIDGNGVPDECGACCEAAEVGYVCRNRLLHVCADVDGMFFEKSTCSERACKTVACCDGPDCAGVLFDCECRELGGFPTNVPSCSPNPCEIGACCTGQGQCQSPVAFYNCGGTYVGGADCTQDPCAAPPSIPCPAANIVSASPPSGKLDARQPHPPGDNSLPRRQGIGSPNDWYAYDPEPITITLDVAGVSDPCCWLLRETGIEQVEAGTPPLNPNHILSVTEMTPPATYRILLERPISARYVTTITYWGSWQSVLYACLPGDANADCTSAPADILAIINYINGLPTPPRLYSPDIDHSGLLGPPDILRVIDLLNGAGTYIPWLNVRLVPNICQPGGEKLAGGGDKLGGDKGVSLENEPGQEGNAEFIDGFVTYVSTAVMVDVEAEQWFKVIVEALTEFGVEHLSAEERKVLAEKLTDPRLAFADERAREIALQAAAILIR